jgi:peptidyl-prolyl cis-trans isomerase D
MLQSIKSKTGTWVLRIFAVLLIISFGAWGVNDMITGGGLPTDVAQVGNTKITANEFNERFRQEMNRLRSVLGPEVDSAQARQLGIADGALERLINRRVLMLEARDLGIVVGDDQIKQAIRGQAAFQNTVGRFDRLVYQQTLARNGLSEGRFVEDLRSDLVQDHLTGIIPAGSTPPGFLTDQLYRYRNEKRVAELVEITRASVAEPPAPTDGQLREFHEKNAAIFTAPEQRDISAIYLDPAKMAEEIKPSEERLREEYENRLSSMSVPERRELRQILSKDENAARRVAERLRSGANFADVALSEAGMKPEATKLGLLQFDELPEKLAKIAFELPKNGISDPVRTALGWHVMMVEKIQPTTKPTFEESRDQIAKSVARELAVDALVKLANKVEDSLAGGAQIEETGSALNFPVIKIARIDASGRNASGVRAPNLPNSARFVETAFATENGQSSDLVETADGGYFILRVDRVYDPKLKPFEEIRAEVRKAWRINQRDEATQKRAKQILDQLKSGATLQSIARKSGLKLSVSKPFTRFKQAPGSKISPSLAAELSRLSRGGAAMSRTRSGYAVAQLREIRAANPAADKKGVDELRQQLASAIGNDILSQFNTALKSRHPVTIDRGAMDRLFNNDLNTNFGGHDESDGHRH